MKRPFALLGGAAFGFLMLASCVKAHTVKVLIPVCAGIGLCTLFALVFLWARGKKAFKKSVKLLDKTRPGAFSLLLSAVLISLTGALFLFLYSGAWETKVAPVESLDGAEARICGTVLDHPQEYNHRIYYVVRVEKVSVNGKTREFPAFKARVSTWLPASCQPYDKVECTVKFSGFDTSGGLYSSRNSWLADGIVLRAYLSDYGNFTVIPNAGSPPGKIAAQWRRILGRCFEKRLPAEEAGMIRAVLLGEKERVADRDYENYKRIGASHLLVISGLHMTALAAAFSLLFGRLRINRVGKNLLTAGAVLGYLALIAFPVSAVRSGIMYLIALLADCLGREADSVNSLGFAVLAICFSNPFSGGDLGFALSVFSTLGILLAADRTTRALLRPFEKRPRLCRALVPVMASLGVTFSAMLFTLPFQVLVFGGISLLAPAASLVLVFPCALLLYAALAAAVFSVVPFLSPLAEPFLFSAGWLARFSLKAAEKLAQVPGAYLRLSDPVWLVALGAALLLLLMICLLKRSRPAVCALLLGILVLYGGGRFLENGEKDTVTLAVIQDSSCVVIMRGHRAAVLSLGGYRTDLAEDLLFQNNIRRVEALCLPVRDQDAREAAVNILESFGAGRLILPEDAYAGRDLHLAGQKSERVYLEEGEAFEILNGITVVSSYQMKRLELTANGVSVIVETGQTGEGSCQVLFTTQTDSRIDSRFTVLQNDAIIEEIDTAELALLPQSQYVFPGKDGLYCDLFGDGSISFRGESVCLK